MPAPRPQAYLALVLHAHQPYVYHPEYDYCLEERWLFEALTESYLPLLQLCERLAEEGLDFQLSFSFSPTLLSMLLNPHIQQRYLYHLDCLEAFSADEMRRCKNEPRRREPACMYRELFARTREDYIRRGADLPAAFAALARAGYIELMSTAATHAYLPLLRTEPGSVEAQLHTAAQLHQQVFGIKARGLWLPECAYYTGLEERVAEAGFEYFVVDSHAVLNASPAAEVYAPVGCAGGCAAFARDPQAARQVWDARCGYPGDPWYRDFYRDAALETDTPVPSYFTAPAGRVPSGLKYHRVTGNEHKQWYEPAAAARRAAVHAADFLRGRQAQLARQAAHMRSPPLSTAPYDAELFGHWWFEGPQWLEQLIRLGQKNRAVLRFTSPAAYLKNHPFVKKTRLSPSSWGEKGYNSFWLNSKNAWIYPYLHRAARDMRELARRFHDTESVLQQRALRAAGRSLMLAQASDWSFLLSSGDVADYAEKRLRSGLARFEYLRGALYADRIREDELSALESLENIFPDLDYRLFAV